MSWQIRGTRKAEAHVIRHVTRIVAPAVALLVVLSCASEAGAVKPRFAFGVVAGAARSTADEAATQRLLEAIGLDRQIAFIAYDGNLKSQTERCDDTVYAQRQQVVETSRAPLVFIPGQYDWADCGSTQAGGYDVLERLDYLRQTFFAYNTSLGQSTLPLIRESEVARFHAYRENVLWQVDDTVFVGLNVVGGNNHYLAAGGRNGEFDDRAIATSFWLEHAAVYARRHSAHALVVFEQADPDFKRYERAERFSWLRFGRRLPRDGYLEYKRSLVKAAQTFRGPVIVIHETTAQLPHGLSIDQPLFDDKGERLANLTRIAIGPRDRSLQWVRIDVNFAKVPPLSVSVMHIPKALPQPPAELPAPAKEAAPGLAPSASGVMPAPPPLIAPAAPASEPPLLPRSNDTAPPGQTPASAPGTGSMQGGS
jgi:hypothetical protein